MTQSLRDAKLGIYEPDNTNFSSPDLEIPKEDIARVNTSERINKQKDTATIELHNDSGQYTSNADIEIRSGQMVVFRIGTQGDIKAWGDGHWGSGAWGGKKLRWTGLIRDVTHTYAGPNKSYIELKAEDFVFGVMALRNVYNTYRDAPIAGSADAVLNTVLENETPEIDTSRIESFPEQTTFTSDGTNALEIAISLSERADAVMYSGRDRLYFEDPETKSSQFELKGTDIGFFDLEKDDAGLANQVRVDGGQDQDVDDEQLTQNGYDTATEESSIQFQISTRKSEIEEVEIWTNKNDNEEQLTVRLQKDDDGAPIAPGDSTSDLASRTLAHEFISHDDFTSFLIPDHTLPEPNPWVIVETDGEEGHQVGIDTSTGTPTYKAWYPYIVTVRQSNRKSQQEHRLREHRIKDESLRDAQEARHVAREKLNHDSVPEKDMSMPAESARTHHLQVGQVIDVDFPREDAVGEFIITKRSDSYENNMLKTTLEAAEVGSI